MNQQLLKSFSPTKHLAQAMNLTLTVCTAGSHVKPGNAVCPAQGLLVVLSAGILQLPSGASRCYTTAACKLPEDKGKLGAACLVLCLAVMPAGPLLNACRCWCC